MGSTSRSNMSATLANFNFVNAVLLCLYHALTAVSHVAISESWSKQNQIKSGKVFLFDQQIGRSRGYGAVHGEVGRFNL